MIHLQLLDLLLVPRRLRRDVSLLLLLLLFLLPMPLLLHPILYRLKRPLMLPLATFQ